MELEFRFRNNDRGPLLPTFQERVNAMLPANRAAAAPAAPAAPADKTASAAAPVLEQSPPATPRMLNTEEMQQALAQVEAEAAQHSQEMILAHSGLNEQRIARLLGLLD
ncbi:MULTISPECIES: pseudouridine synthase [unclassified Desulfovibrio]|uniref:pseudouridine synthase n=1 Tax=unclassified Desulfovibrio TaxID=2593640 RepID=UPI000F5E841D|nr:MULTISPECIES: pseudouridine synthase [unclassified Desulfovibrio]RRD72376.1 pseudouridine synthase [Desulfovibrio sp. OH1209_COT-279]RRD88487.1 pseudouridine synthase [Desulfovibrio sp. OH1186_COT-070]